MESRDSLNLRGLRELRGHFSAVGYIEKKSLIFKRVGTTPATPALASCSSEIRLARPTDTDTAKFGAWNTKMNDNYEAQDTRAVARFSSHRPTAIQLPDDPRLATAAVLAFVLGQDGIERAAAIEALTARAALLAEADPDEAIAALAEQLPVLNAMFLVFTAESVATKNSDARAKYVKLALNSQSAYARTQALVIGLRLQSKGRAQVVLRSDDGDEP